MLQRRSATGSLHRQEGPRCTARSSKCLQCGGMAKPRQLLASAARLASATPKQAHIGSPPRLDRGLMAAAQGGSEDASGAATPEDADAFGTGGVYVQFDGFKGVWSPQGPDMKAQENSPSKASRQMSSLAALAGAMRFDEDRITQADASAQAEWLPGSPYLDILAMASRTAEYTKETGAMSWTEQAKELVQLCLINRQMIWQLEMAAAAETALAVLKVLMSTRMAVKGEPAAASPQPLLGSGAQQQGGGQPDSPTLELLRSATTVQGLTGWMLPLDPTAKQLSEATLLVAQQLQEGAAAKGKVSRVTPGVLLQALATTAALNNLADLVDYRTSFHKFHLSWYIIKVPAVRGFVQVCEDFVLEGLEQRGYSKEHAKALTGLMIWSAIASIVSVTFCYHDQLAAVIAPPQARSWFHEIRRSMSAFAALGRNEQLQTSALILQLVQILLANPVGAAAAKYRTEMEVWLHSRVTGLCSPVVMMATRVLATELQQTAACSHVGIPVLAVSPVANVMAAAAVAAAAVITAAGMQAFAKPLAVVAQLLVVSAALAALSAIKRMQPQQQQQAASSSSSSSSSSSNGTPAASAANMSSSAL